MVALYSALNRLVLIYIGCTAFQSFSDSMRASIDRFTSTTWLLVAVKYIGQALRVYTRHWVAYTARARLIVYVSVNNWIAPQTSCRFLIIYMTTQTHGNQWSSTDVYWVDANHNKQKKKQKRTRDKCCVHVVWKRHLSFEYGFPQSCAMFDW